MADIFETYLNSVPDSGDKSYPEVQRTALDEFIKLTTPMAEPIDKLIESRYSIACNEIQNQWDTAIKHIENRYKSTFEKLDQERAKQIAEIQQQYENDRRTLNTDHQARHDAIMTESEIAEQKIKEDSEYEIIMADNIAEGAVTKNNEQQEVLNLAVDEAKEHLAEMKKQAQAAISRFPGLRIAHLAAAEAVAADNENTGDHHAEFRRHNETAQRQLQQLQKLIFPLFFSGPAPWFLSGLAGLIVLGAAGLAHNRHCFGSLPFGITGAAAFLAGGIMAWLICRRLKKTTELRVSIMMTLFDQAVTSAESTLLKRHQRALAQLENKTARAKETCLNQKQKIRDHQASKTSQTKDHRQNNLQQLENEYHGNLTQIESDFQKQQRHITENYNQDIEQLNHRKNNELDELAQQYQTKLDDIQNRGDAARQDVARRRQMGLTCIESAIHKTKSLDGWVGCDWSDPQWQNWRPGLVAQKQIRFGQLTVAPKLLSSNIWDTNNSNRIPDFSADQELNWPAVLSLPDRGSLLLQTRHEGREAAMALLQAVMIRLMTALPPGQVRFTILDPVGLGENFAGFMHAADYNDALVGGRIWSDAPQIQQRLTELTEHIEKVIQKYLRNEFETIDAYNAQAGELAEPYRFLVIGDFPANFNEESAQRLASIINSGPRCGVYTLIAHDTRRDLPTGIHLEDLVQHSVHLAYEQGRFAWQDEVIHQFPLTPDSPPTEQLLTKLVHLVGEGAKNAARVEVPFETVAPRPEQFWSQDCAEELRIPVGRSGATRLQYLSLGRGMTQHALIAGRTGSGKSTLLHVLITNLSLWFSPEQVELYLIDFKRGVEFKSYVTHSLPHARAIAIESDREFGLSILERLEAEMARRGELFRQAGVQDLAGYRRATGQTLPRTLLMVDEFQVFFAEDDRLAHNASLLLEQLVRQGRAFGVHVILGTQTLGGMSGLARSTLGQMAVRIALQCSEADAQLILSDENIAARLLARPGEAIYNDAGGLLVGNSPFQTTWLSDVQRDDWLRKVTQLTADHQVQLPKTIVFEGNTPSDITTNTQLAQCLRSQPDPDDSKSPPRAWLGDPMAIKDPLAVAFRRQNGANLLIIGQRDESAAGLLACAMLSLAAQQSPKSANFVLFDAGSADAAPNASLSDIAAYVPHSPKQVDPRNLPQTLTDLASELERRQQTPSPDSPSIYLIIYGLQRYRELRRQEDDYGFSADDRAAAKPDRQLASIIREGPMLGIHTLIWADTLSAAERVLDRQSFRAFDYMVLFQMNASDSSHLIDSPAANQLGYHRALLYSEERGTLERFRPYGPPPKHWLQTVKSQINQRFADR